MVSYGGGANSTALLVGLHQHHIPVDLVLFADTGAEHPHTYAYLDIMDSNPNTKSYEDLLPPNAQYNEEQLKNTLKRRKDSFRRFRDLSIFAFIGVYLISIIDAYVDAELSNFDITPDLSMKVEPAVIDNNNQFRSNSLKSKSVGLQCVLRF